VRNYGKLEFFRRNYLSDKEFELSLIAPCNYGKLAQPRQAHAIVELARLNYDEGEAADYRQGVTPCPHRARN
jgi:hypothetical protein